MRLCAAQLAPSPGDLEANLEQHARLIALAARHQADLLLFPELSLTGYEPTLAHALSTSIDETHRARLQALSDQHHLIIGVGLPLPHADKPQIGLLFFRPQQAPERYAKQLLHADECPYFSTGTQPLALHTHGEICVPAICYESVQMPHAEQAQTLGLRSILPVWPKTPPRLAAPKPITQRSPAHSRCPLCCLTVSDLVTILWAQDSLLCGMREALAWLSWVPTTWALWDWTPNRTC